MHDLYSSNRKKVMIIDENREEIKKNISYTLDLFIVQDLWQVHCQIVSIIFPKEFIELNVNLYMMIKTAKLAELNISTAIVFLNIQTLKTI